MTGMSALILSTNLDSQIALVLKEATNMMGWRSEAMHAEARYLMARRAVVASHKNIDAIKRQIIEEESRPLSGWNSASARSFMIADSYKILDRYNEDLKFYVAKLAEAEAARVKGGHTHNTVCSRDPRFCQR